MVPLRVLSAADERAAHDAAAGGARYLAGGTTLVDLLKLHVEQPAAIVDINRIGWAAIEPTDDRGVRIGGLVRNSDMAHHELVRTRYPMLAQAILAGASPQIRNM